MYFIWDELTLRWTFTQNTGIADIVNTDLGVVVREPGGSQTFYDYNSMTGFVAPDTSASPQTPGTVDYVFTPETQGYWTVMLVTGAATTYKELDRVRFYIHCDVQVEPPASYLAAYPTSLPIVSGCTNAPLDLVLSDADDEWYLMTTICRHATDDTKLVISGSENNTTQDIGILDLNTGLITKMTDALAGIGGSPSQGPAGMACNPNTGIYVLSSSRSESSQYYTYWSTDLTTWTKCTDDISTASHANGGVCYDENHDMWYWFTGIKTLTSYTGKHFNVQSSNLASPAGLTEVPQCKDWLHSGMHSGVPGDHVYIAGITERYYKVLPDNLNAPIDTDNWLDVSPYPTPGLLTSGNPNFIRVNYYDGAIYMSTNAGEIVKSTTGDAGDWTVLTANQVGEDTNEIITTGGNWHHMHVINDTWWASQVNGGPGGWWRWGTGGEPAGNGWVNDSTGPFGTRYEREQVTTKFSARLRIPTMKFAALTYTTSPTRFRVLYDQSQL